MKVGPVQSSGKIVQTPEKVKSRDGIKKNSVRTDDYIPGSTVKVPTYARPVGKVNQAAIHKLRAESEKAFESLRRLVEQLLQRQGYSVRNIQAGLDELQVDETARVEAAALIAEDGPLGAEAVSNRIVEFAIAISGGDKSKVEQLKGAIEEGFRQVREMLGGLPEVSVKTYDLVMSKLDDWVQQE
jgi:hypothetical protein